MERLTERDEFGNADIIALSDMMPKIYAELSFSETNALTDVLNRLAAYEDMMERWRMRDIAEVENIFRRVNALGGTDRMAEYKKQVDSIVHCRDCKHLYFKDFEASCQYRAGMCRPGGFCERGERQEDDTRSKAAPELGGR